MGIFLHGGLIYPIRALGKLPQAVKKIHRRQTGRRAKRGADNTDSRNK